MSLCLICQEPLEVSHSAFSIRCLNGLHACTLNQEISLEHCDQNEITMASELHETEFFPQTV